MPREFTLISYGEFLKCKKNMCTSVFYEIISLSIVPLNNIVKSHIKLESDR